MKPNIRSPMSAICMLRICVFAFHCNLFAFASILLNSFDMFLFFLHKKFHLNIFMHQTRKQRSTVRVL